VNYTREDVIAFIQEVHFGQLATVNAEGAPRVRPVGIKDVYGDDIYFMTLAMTRKVAEMAAEPRVEVNWVNLAELAQVRVEGVAELVEDGDTVQQFMGDNANLAGVLPPGTEQFIQVYRIKPTKVWMAKGMVPYTDVEW
jgi:general stress protein 26